MLETVLHWLGYGLCHQLPARSFFGGGVQVPVCARDTGIYVGFVVSLLVMGLIDRRRHRSGLPRPWVLALGGVMVAVMAWDGVTSYAGLRQTTNDLRLLSGLMCGWALPLIVAPILGSQLWRDASGGRVLDGAAEVVPWLVALPLTFALARWGLPLLGVGYPLLVAVCIVVTFVTVNAIIVTLAPRFESRALRLIDGWPAFLFAAVLAFVEVGAAAWLRAYLQKLVVG